MHDQDPPVDEVGEGHPAEDLGEVPVHEVVPAALGAALLGEAVAEVQRRALVVAAVHKHLVLAEGNEKKPSLFFVRLLADQEVPFSSSYTIISLQFSFASYCKSYPCCTVLMLKQMKHFWKKNEKENSSER